MALNQEEPPPSTLAAHILRNGSISSTQRDPGIRDHFNKLLQNFLDNPGVETGDEKFEENHRFVCWLADATVECRKADEPFTPNANIESAAGCLNCIWYTIDRHPEVLQYNGADCNTQSPNPPLMLRLLAKLLSVAAKEGPNAVWDGLVKVLSQCLSAQLARPGTWAKGVVLAKFLDSTLDGMD
jgi:serine/threonine-protein kinase ATR